MGKDDKIDATAAARKVLSGEITARAKDSRGAVESIRTLRMVRDSAVKARTAALMQLQDFLVTAPASLRESINAKTGRAKVRFYDLRKDLLQKLGLTYIGPSRGHCFNPAPQKQ